MYLLLKYNIAKSDYAIKYIKPLCISVSSVVRDLFFLWGSLSLRVLCGDIFFNALPPECKTGNQDSNITASISTCASLGRAATPTAARAG